MTHTNGAKNDEKTTKEEEEDKKCLILMCNALHKLNHELGEMQKEEEMKFAKINEMVKKTLQTDAALAAQVQGDAG